MSKEIGVIGNQYENRKTGRIATLTERDVEGEQLTFIDTNEEEFYVSFKSFRSMWRKFTAVDVAEEIVEQQEEKFDESGIESVTVVMPAMPVEEKTTVEAKKSGQKNRGWINVSNEWYETILAFLEKNYPEDYAITVARNESIMAKLATDVEPQD